MERNQAGVINVKKIIFNLFIIFTSLFITSSAWSLPNCFGNEPTYWDNCFGSQKYTDGSSYLGNWQDGEWHGWGVARGEQDRINYEFRGEFKNDQPDGLMTITANGGKFFHGELNDKQGMTLGVISFNANNRENIFLKKSVKKLFLLGDKYVGEINNDLFDGEGAFLDFSEGVIKIGTFKKGKLVIKSNKPLYDYELVPYESANAKEADNAYSKSIGYLKKGNITDSNYWLLIAARNNHKLAIKKYQAVQHMSSIEQKMNIELRKRFDDRQNAAKYVSNIWTDSGPTDKEVREAKEYLQSLEQENTFDQNMKKVMTIAAVAMALGDDAATAFNTAFEAVFGTNANNYDGPCPCPYSIASDGSQCGKRSAYTRTGGAAPACY